VSADYTGALVEARALAAADGRTAASLDVLLGLLRAGGAAARLLGERGIAAPRSKPLRPKCIASRNLDLAALECEAQGIAQRVGAQQTSSLHLLLAVLRLAGSGTEALRRTGHDPGKVRALVLRALTGPGPSADRRTDRAPPGLAAVGEHELIADNEAQGDATPPLRENSPESNPAPLEQSPRMTAEEVCLGASARGVAPHGRFCTESARWAACWIFFRPRPHA